MSIGGAILSEISGTFFLVLAIWVATDNSRKIVTGTKIFAPAVIGIAGTGILACLGQQTGGAINPAIDLGSRLMSALIYESDEVWVFPSSNLHSAGEAYRIRRKMVKIRSVRVLLFFFDFFGLSCLIKQAKLKLFCVLVRVIFCKHSTQKNLFLFFFRVFFCSGGFQLWET